MNLSKILLQELFRTSALAFILLALLAVPYRSGQISLLDSVLILSGSGVLLYAVLCRARLSSRQECATGTWVYAGLALTAVLLLLALADLTGLSPYLYELLPLFKGLALAGLAAWLSWRLHKHRNSLIF